MTLTVSNSSLQLLPAEGTHPLINYMKYGYYWCRDVFCALSKADLILQHLFLGDLIAGNDQDFLEKEQIQCIINLSGCVFPETTRFCTEYGIHVLNIKIRDHPRHTDRFISLIHHVVDLVHHFRCQEKNVLIHCSAGKQRSAVVVVCYLLKYIYHLAKCCDHNETTTRKILKCIGFVRSKRPVAFQSSIHFLQVMSFVCDSSESGHDHDDDVVAQSEVISRSEMVALTSIMRSSDPPTPSSSHPMLPVHRDMIKT